MEILDMQGDKDMSNKRVINLDNGNKIHLERQDPFGMIKIHWDRGAMPVMLRGSYTSFDLAYKAVERYLHEQRRTAVDEPAPLRKSRT